MPRTCLRNEKKAVKHEGDSCIKHNWEPWNNPEGPGKETGGAGDLWKN